MNNIIKKRFLLTIILTFLFLFGSVVSPDVLSSLTFIRSETTNINLTTKSIIGSEVVYAAPRGASGGFHSGSFKSTPKASTSSGFKSGGFSSTPKSSTKSSSGSTSPSGNIGSSSPNYNSNRSYIPIPIPIFGHSGYYGGSSIVGGFMSGFIKFILFLVILIVIIRIFKKRR